MSINRASARRTLPIGLIVRFGLHPQGAPNDRCDLSVVAAWADVAAGQRTGSARLTPLRALDTVVWTLGKTNPPSDTDVNG